MKDCLCVIIICLLSFCNKLSAQQTIPLYPGVIPNTTSNTIKEFIVGPADDPIAYYNITIPTLRVYLPEKDKINGSAVIIFPGGGYEGLAYKDEGSNIAINFAKQGITAFVVKYRLPNDSIMQDKSIGPLQDAQQAIKSVRMNAAAWNLDVNRIGIIGFSAGGHLASTLGTHFNYAYIPNTENTNLRPDFMILLYPVISMKGKLTHAGSKYNLLGTNPSQEKTELFSNEDQVTPQTPPTWIAHTKDDEIVKVDNSIVFYKALLKNKVPTEIHLYPTGNHGFVLHIPPMEWMQPILIWMQKGGWMKDSSL